jgi:hypothetical protein
MFGRFSAHQGLPWGLYTMQDVVLNGERMIVQDQRFTAWYDKDRDNKDDGAGGGENSAIDHVLVSQKLWDLVSEVDIIHEAPVGVGGEALSDHWPIVVTFGTPGQTVKNNAISGSTSAMVGVKQWIMGIWIAFVAVVIHAGGV